MSENTQALADLDALLDLQLDDLADLPAFKTFQPGTHIAVLKLDKKLINDKPSVEAKFTLRETEELNNPSDVPDAPGTESSVAYNMTNEFGMGSLKDLLKPLAAAFGVGDLRGIMEATNNSGAGTEVRITTKTRPDKNDKDKLYLVIKSLEVL